MKNTIKVTSWILLSVIFSQLLISCKSYTTLYKVDSKKKTQLIYADFLRVKIVYNNPGTTSRYSKYAWGYIASQNDTSITVTKSKTFFFPEKKNYILRSGITLLQERSKGEKQILLHLNDEFITKKVKAHDRFMIAGGAAFGVGIAFILGQFGSLFGEVIVGGDLDYDETESAYLKGASILAGIGVTLIVIGDVQYNKAIKRYNEIVIVPTSNGVGLVYRF